VLQDMALARWVLVQSRRRRSVPCSRNGAWVGGRLEPGEGAFWGAFPSVCLLSCLIVACVIQTLKTCRNDSA
jgi:hypothetical protein